MKKSTQTILVIVLALIALLPVALTGCGGGTQDETQQGTEQSTQQPTQQTTQQPTQQDTQQDTIEGDTVYFLHKGLDYYAWVAMQEQFVKFANDNGVKFELLNAENDASRQV